MELRCTLYSPIEEQMIKFKLPTIHISKVRKLWVLLFIQVWVWPQCFWMAMPASYGFSMGLTMVGAIMWNIITLIDAHDEARDR